MADIFQKWVLKQKQEWNVSHFYGDKWYTPKGFQIFSSFLRNDKSQMNILEMEGLVWQYCVILYQANNLLVLSPQIFYKWKG